jgi:hypothetical protein
VREVIQTYGPVTMGIERVFMARNADSALKLGQARGAAVAGAEEGLEIAEYTATQVKQAVAGTGGANKEQVMMMVMHLLKLTSKPQIDASDALAIAICHAHTRSSLLPHGLATQSWRAPASLIASAQFCGFFAGRRPCSVCPRLAKGSERDWTFARHPGGKTAAAPDSRRQRLGMSWKCP